MGKEESQTEDPNVFERRFKYCLFAYAIIEFVVIALIVYYKVTR